MANGSGGGVEPRGAVHAALRWFDTVASAATGLLIYIACLFMFAMVITRYFFAYSDPSVEIVARYMMIWATFIGVSCAVKGGGNIRFTLVEHLLSPGPRRIFMLAGHLVALVICAGIAWSGVALVDETIMFDEVMPTRLRWPVWIFHLSVPVGGTLLILQIVRAILESLRAPAPADKPA